MRGKGYWGPALRATQKSNISNCETSRGKQITYARLPQGGAHLDAGIPERKGVEFKGEGERKAVHADQLFSFWKMGRQAKPGEGKTAGRENPRSRGHESFRRTNKKKRQRSRSTHLTEEGAPGPKGNLGTPKFGAK